jgi:hypothetical protein
MVEVAGNSYICLEDHTSGTFATDYAAAKWQILAGAIDAEGLDFTPPDGMTSTDVQAAIEEVNTRAVSSLALVASLYGAL